jgi:hypothetical protein
MGGNPGLDNGEWMMRRNTDQTPDPYLLAAWDKAMAQQQQQTRNQYLFGLYGNVLQSPGALLSNLTPRAWSNAQSGGPAPGERAAEDVTGLRLLEEFLAKRKGERDGDERK